MLNLKKESLLRKAVISLCFLFVTTGAIWAQGITVTGKITDTKGDAVVGAYVLVEGAKTGTSADFDGNYSIVVSSTGRLVFSSMGYSEQIVPVNGRAIINVVMEEDAYVLDNVVVVGYGVMKKRDVTASISQIKGEDLANKASPSFMQSLAGKASGVQVISPSGDVSTPPTIIIRGMSSISSGTSPLYVINGIPVTSGQLSGGYSNNNALSDINPSDIESMEILKDGAATAIFGSRASNGVVLITTKQGRQGATKVSYDGWFAVSNASKLPQLLNAAEFVQITGEKYASIGAENPAVLDPNVDTDWVKAMYRAGMQQSHSVSITGGTDKTQYYISGSYSDQQGVLTNNSMTRFTTYSKFDQKVLKNYLAFGITFNGAYQNNNGPLKGTNSLSDNMYGGTKMHPNVPIFNPDHPTGYNIDYDSPKALGRWKNKLIIDNDVPNIIWTMDNNIQDNVSIRLIPTAYLELKPLAGLSFKTILGADVSYVDDRYVWKKESGDGYGYQGLVSQRLYKRQRWTFQNILSYTKDFGDHHIDATAVAEWTKYESSNYGGSVYDISDPYFVNHIVSNTFGTWNVYGGISSNGLASYAFRANYNWKSMLYIGGSYRYDGLSRLSEATRWGSFYGGSVAFRLSELDFWKSGNFGRIVSDFRLRGSYAEVGNDAIGDFPYVDIFSGQKYGNQVGLSYYQSGNPLLEWEKQQILDVGFDMTILGRFNFTFSYWQKNNSDIVLWVPTPPSLGIPWNEIPQNYGKVDNNGIEFEIGGLIINKTDFSWRTNLNFSTQKSIVNTLVDDIMGTNNMWIYREGEAVRSLYGYIYEGVNMANGNPMYKKADGTIIWGDAAKNRYYEYNASNPIDDSKVSSLSVSDMTILGNPVPTYFGGWDNTFTYKNFDLNIFFRFSGGNKVANLSERDMLSQLFHNNSVKILDRWQSPEKPGDGTVPKLVYGTNSFTNLDGSISSRWVEDGSFVKLQNLALGYNLPENIAKKLLLSKVRIYIQAQNLFTLTKYSGLDPEVFTSSYGIDYNGNPQQRAITIGLNVGF